MGHFIYFYIKKGFLGYLKTWDGTWYHLAKFYATWPSWTDSTRLKGGRVHSWVRVFNPSCLQIELLLLREELRKDHVVSDCIWRPPKKNDSGHTASSKSQEASPSAVTAPEQIRKIIQNSVATLLVSALFAKECAFQYVSCLQASGIKCKLLDNMPSYTWIEWGCWE